MSIWVHREIGAAPSIGEIAGMQCRFCDAPLIQERIEDRWTSCSKDITELHQATVLEMAEIHGDFIVREMDLINEPDERTAYLSTCALCGWWHVSKEVYLHTKNQVWFVEFGWHLFGSCLALWCLKVSQKEFSSQRLRFKLAVQRW